MSEIETDAVIDASSSNDKQPTKKKKGRPHKDFDANVFQALCRIQCTQEEICLVLETTTKTLNAWCKRTYKEDFLQAYKRFSVDGKMSIRRSMYEKATKDKNTTMLIWLSKQYLGMTDKVQVDQTEVLNKLDSVLDGIKDEVDSEVKEE